MLLLLMPAAATSHVGVACSSEHFPVGTAGDMQIAKERAQDAAHKVIRSHLTFLKKDVLQMHIDFLLEMETAGRSGMILECGVAKGGSAIVMAAAKRRKRCLHLFDTFSGMPPPSSRDGDDVHRRYRVIKSGGAGRGYYGYMSDLLNFDQQMFRTLGYPPDKHNVIFHKGMFNETLHPAGRVAYAHVDGDWYDSVFSVLDAIETFMVHDGVIVLDDVVHYSGARKAYTDFFNTQLSAIPHSKSTANVRNATTSCVTRRGTKFDLFFVHGRYGAIRRRE